MTDEREGDPARLPWPAMLPWQVDTARAELARRASWPHALLLHGPRGIGKHALALQFAQALLCETSRGDGLACGMCAGCRYAVAGQHPDLMRLELLVVDPEEDTLQAVDAIAIDRVRALTDFVQLTSHRQRAKVAVIAPAERMNAAAANALLKTLEEPPAGTFLILVSDQPGRVPATLRSRCRLLAAPVPTWAEACAWLAAEGVSAPELAARPGSGGAAPRHRAGGSRGAGRAPGLDRGARPRRKRSRCRGSRRASMPEARTSERRGYRVHSSGCSRGRPILRASLRAMRRGRTPMPPRRSHRLAPRVAPIALFRYHRSLLQRRAIEAHPLQPRLVAEAMLLDYRALF